MAATSWNVNAREFTPGANSVVDEVVAAPKLRVDAPEFVPEDSKSITLHDQLFGDASPLTREVSGSVLPAIPQHISPSLVQQLLVQADKQVLELGNFLATRGTVTSAQDLILIRLQLQQLQSLKTSLNAVLNPLPTIGGQKIVPALRLPPASSSGGGQYAALLAQAAQYAMSAVSVSNHSLNKSLAISHSRTATASSTAAVSPNMSPKACGQLTVGDLGALVFRVIEKACDQTVGDACSLGLPTSALKKEWVKCYPSLSPLLFYLEMFHLRQVKDLLVGNKALVLFYASLPSPHLRVATRVHFERKFDPSHPSAKLINLWGTALPVSSPLISPTSTCSYTSVDHPQPAAKTRVLIEEVILKVVREDQLEFLRDKKSFVLVEILNLVGGKRLLDSKRPPPITTHKETDSNVKAPSVDALFAQFRSLAAPLLKQSSVVNVAQVEALWRSEVPGVPFPTLSSLPGVQLVGATQCVLSAMSLVPPVEGLFSMSDSTIWNASNERLINLLKQFCQPLNSMSSIAHLSSILFKSITAGGKATAAQCATALKVLAAKDPHAIHEIVSAHIANKGPMDASAFVSSLIQRGQEVANEKPRYTRDELLHIRKELSAPPGLKK